MHVFSELQCVLEIFTLIDPKHDEHCKNTIRVKEMWQFGFVDVLFPSNEKV